MATRRDVVKGLGAAALAGVAIPSVVRAQGLTKIQMGFGIKSINPIIINILIGSGLGYYAEEGLDFTARPLGTNSNAQIAVDKWRRSVRRRHAELPDAALRQERSCRRSSISMSTPIPINGTSQCCRIRPLKGYESLKGKKIGVSDLGTTDYPVTRAVIKNIGLDPDKDVTWIAVGAGVTRASRCSAASSMRWLISTPASARLRLPIFRCACSTVRRMCRLIGGLFLSAMEDYIKANRKICVGFARGVAKSSEFLLANPEAGAKVFLKLFPETAPRGASEADAVKSVLFAAQRAFRCSSRHIRTPRWVHPPRKSCCSMPSSSASTMSPTSNR